MTLSFDPARPALAAVPAGAMSARGLDIRIGDETPFDVAAREALLDAAFGRGRDAKTSARLRDGRLPADGLALVAKDRGALIGTLRCWHVRAGGCDALLLGPLAVAESHRSLGIGARLMREALWRAAMFGHKAVLLVGDAPYYARFGFDAALTGRLDLPGPVDRARFLAFEIEDGALDGASGLVVATGARGEPRRRAGQHLKQAA
jgi:predicted N-acetyltransferase YhbS